MRPDTPFLSRVEKQVKHIHFIGISGAGLSALAQVMLGRGYEVSGSDASAPNAVTDEVGKRGAKIYAGHSAENIAGADLIVATSAAPSDNPEIAAAHYQQIPILKRREFLREVTRGNDVIAVAGSHGKTTTTALIAMMLEEAGLDPTAVVGGIVPAWNTNARVGKSKWFVVEADEYDYAFLGLEPKIAVLTNVDYDHPDLFPTRAEYQNAFAEFLAQTREDGALIVCGDEHAASALAARVGRKVIRYGLGETNAWRATDLGVNAAGGNNFKIFQEKHFVGDAASKIPGEHNVLNALAAMAVAQECEIAFDVSRSTLAKFIGVERRFQIRGAFHGAMLVDDYAHHPTEIRATLQAARQRFPNARVVALFQPHTFTRTRALWDEFANAFQDADVVLLAEIYAAREKEDAGLSSRALAGRITREHVRFVATLAEAETMLRDELRGGDVLVTLGAGNVNQVIARLLENENA